MLRLILVLNMEEAKSRLEMELAKAKKEVWYPPVPRCPPRSWHLSRAIFSDVDPQSSS
jgi:hypothetical protein